MVGIADKSAARQLARIAERERSGTELGQPGAAQFAPKERGSEETHSLVAMNTGHLTKATAEALANPPEDGPTVAVFPEGWFVSCLIGSPSEFADLEAIRQWARERGYGYVLLDRDASDVDGLPLYDW